MKSLNFWLLIESKISGNDGGDGGGGSGGDVDVDVHDGKQIFNNGKNHE